MLSKNSSRENPRKNIIKLNSPLILGVFLVLNASVNSAEARQCEDLFKKESVFAKPIIEEKLSPRQSVSQYLQSARQKALGAKPTFVTVDQDRAAFKTWSGLQGPKLIQELLPKGLTLIDHELVGANEDGVVKTSTGNMIHLRAQLSAKSSTNIAINIGAIKSNFLRDTQKTKRAQSIVRDEAKAVIVFIHGGGTSTTGHHVAASLMSWMSVYGVDVISMDMPWHAEGDRNSYKSVPESLGQIRDLIRNYITPSGKKVILVGHSMGGIVSDIYRRSFPKDDLVSAVIPLSTVADPLPGASRELKFAQEILIEKKNSTNIKIPESERELGASLARQNKISPTCGLFCEFLMFGLEWKMPAHRGENYVPALYVIGEGDGLYQGYEKSFQEGVVQLKNTEFRVIGQRRDIKDKEGALIPTGHLIFDHKPFVEVNEEVSPNLKKKIYDGSISEADFNSLREKGLIKLDSEYHWSDLNDPEVFVMMKNFIAKQIGENLQKTKTTYTPLEIVVQAYTNNLVFREFAKNYIFQYLRSTERGVLLGEELDRVSQELKVLTKVDVKTMSPEQLQHFNQLKAQSQKLQEILKNKGEISETNKNEFLSLKAELQEINSKNLSQLNSRKKLIKSEVEKIKNEVTRHEKFMAELEKTMTSEKIKSSRALTERAFTNMMKQYDRVREMSYQYLNASYQNGKFKKDLFETLPENLSKAFSLYVQASKIYQNQNKKHLSLVLQEAALGTLTVLDSSSKNISNLPFEYQKAALELGRLSQENIQKMQELQSIDQEIVKFSLRVFEIEKRTAELMGAEYFSVEYYTIEDLLSLSHAQASQQRDHITNILQRIWAEWQKLWSVRVVEINESLY